MKTQKTEHSPLPWRYGHTGPVMHGYDQSFAISTNDNRFILAGCFNDIPGEDKTAEANAALIVRAVNSHETLVKALTLMQAHIDDLYKSNKGFMGKLCLQDYGLWNKALLSMDAALKLAKGS